jgi:hypothetical protein
LFLCFTLFLWGKFSDLSASPQLSTSCDGLMIIFQFCSVVWLWMSLAQEMSFVDHYLPYFRQQLITGLLLAFLLFQSLLSESSSLDQLLAHSPSLVCFQQLSPSAVC